jgi:hypothetical protein
MAIISAVVKIIMIDKRYNNFVEIGAASHESFSSAGCLPDDVICVERSQNSFLNAKLKSYVNQLELFMPAYLLKLWNPTYGARVSNSCNFSA